MHISKILILLINLQLIFLFFQDRRVKLYKKDENFYSEDVIKKLSIVLADGIYVDTLNLKLRIQNQISGFNWNQPRIIYLGEDINDYIKIPKGLLETLLNKCDLSKIEYKIIDKREKGKSINVSFTGKLRDEHFTTASDLLSYNTLHYYSKCFTY